MILTCVVCGDDFTRRGSRGPIPKYCGQRCISRAARTPHRVAYEREFRRSERAAGKRIEYERAYNQRPEVKARMIARYYAFYRDPFVDLEIPAPYTGHRWLDMARKAVGAGDLDSSTPWADDYHDEMGEAVLALLEGRDMAEAVTAYRKKEYIPRRMTMHMGDWGDDPDQQQR